MGIQVRCPHGHSFKVKEKYAGKRGLCPHCTGQVVVDVPALETVKAEEAYRQAIINEHRAPGADGHSSVFDDQPSTHGSASSSGSLLGASVMRHKVRCECGASVPMWFAKCPSCGAFLQNR